jgi:hypothetical protein
MEHNTIEYQSDGPFIYQYENYIILLSDFIYKHNDGNNYKMCVNKGYNGRWFVFKHKKTKKLYASDNVWSSGYGTNTESKKWEGEVTLIEKDCKYEDFKAKYIDKKKNIIIINDMSFIDDHIIDNVKNICNDSITVYNKLLDKRKKLDILNKYKKTLIICSTDSESFWINMDSVPRDINNLDDCIYNVSYGSYYGDAEHKYNSIVEAYKEVTDQINNYYDEINLYNLHIEDYDKTLLNINDNNNRDIDLIIQNSQNCGLILAKSAKYDRYFCKQYHPLIYKNYFLLPQLLFFSLKKKTDLKKVSLKKRNTSKQEKKFGDVLLNIYPDICHQYNIKSTQFDVDFFDKKTNTVIEFLGDYWHGNPEKYHPNDMNTVAGKSYGVLHNDTFIRLKKITSLGYKVLYIWENKWIEYLKKKNDVNDSIMSYMDKYEENVSKNNKTKKLKAIKSKKVKLIKVTKNLSRC